LPWDWARGNPRFFIWDFAGPVTFVAGQKFHYTIPPAICQEEILYKKLICKIP
jgi:hypothetical protein